MNVEASKTLMPAKPLYLLIGGGGFAHCQDPEIEDFILDQCAERPTSIGYIGAANNDMPERIDRFYDRFAGLANELSHLPVTARDGASREWISRQCVIYIAGGNTFALMEFLEQRGLGESIRGAAERGSVIVGSSAGASCLSTSALSASGGRGLEPVRGLGILPGSFCPHYTEDPERRPHFEKHIANGNLPAGFGVSEGSCVAVRSGSEPSLLSARTGSGAWFVSKAGSKVVIDPVRLLS